MGRVRTQPSSCILCDKPPIAKNLCWMHYRRQLRTGTTDKAKSREQYVALFVVEYRTWINMWQRCWNTNHPQYEDYGGRGIRIHSSWLSFKQFLLDMGQKPNKSLSLERKDNDGDYTPDNCAWASRTEQNNNTRKNKLLSIG